MNDILILYQSGLSCKTIAAKLSIPLRRVRGIVKVAGITRPPNNWLSIPIPPDERPLVIELPKAGIKIVSSYRKTSWYTGTPI